ncbi:MAG TPA: putative sugar nucleotidyl transferase [Candidatus Wunengus sp. YC60]|uniref:putative sugar nucleotidyl transferase n=1 Tax=Candidatus Wunengus sp. YC60 TaxID=3367697 RepID=UPI0040285C50
MQQICVFEDSQHSQLIPLVYAKPVFELRCGLFSNLERTVKHYPDAAITLFCRNYLSDILKEKYPHRVNTLHTTDNACLFLNGRAIISLPVPLEGPEEIGVQDNTLVYARLKGNNVKKISHEKFLTPDVIDLLKGTLPVVDTHVPIINYFWDIIKHNKSQIEKDFMLFVKEGSISGKLYEGVYLINEDLVFIGKGSRVKPGCVFDAENGPIYIGNNASIAPNTTIEGPVYVGNHSIIQSNSRIRGGANIGEGCKVGGEIVNTIFHSHSNKQHDGFLGDSYIGSWINIGADTVNSNLLNTYGNIKVELGGDIINTNHLFLGMAMGDHTKTAINTTIMTGSVFGFACNIITPAYPPKYLPSFTWYSDNGMKVYILEKALQVARIAMKRRDKEMTPTEEQLFRMIFQLTEKERNSIKIWHKQELKPDSY